MDRTKKVLAVEAIMTREERKEFLDLFWTSYPGMKGAKVADALDILDNHDAHLRVIEPMMEQNFSDPSYDGGMVRLCMYAVIYMKGMNGLNLVLVRDLYRRAMVKFNEQ